MFARLLGVCKARPRINLEEAVGKYKFSVVPRSLFAPDCAMLHCLMNILDKLPGNDETLTSTISKNECKAEGSIKTVFIADAMTEVQTVAKPKNIRLCSDLAQSFTDRILIEDTQ